MYAELTCKSNFSFLRGASDAREYVSRAAELGLSAIGIADVNGVYALPRAFEQMKHLSHLQSELQSNLRLISGAELTLSRHPPLTLLAQNRKGYALLCRLLTAAHHGKPKGEATLSVSELIALINESTPQPSLIAIPNLGTHATLEQTAQLGVLKELFGTNLYLPLCRYLDGLDEKRTEQVLRLAHDYDLSIVAHNDVHYANPERSRLQDCLTAIREKTTVPEAGFKLFGNRERYLKSPLQMRSLFKDQPQAIENTLHIAESCTFSLSELTYTYPLEWLPPGHDSQSYLEHLVYEGAHEIYRGLIPDEVAAQIAHELRLIKKLNYSSYFLTIYDIVRFARSKNILCQGRGSAANSICCYCLKITAIDPVRMNLLFERFISEERGEPPDIDVDFEHERREEVIQWIYQRYGRERAAMVAAVRTYQPRSAFLEISKAVGLPIGTLSAQELERNFDTIAGEKKHLAPVIDALIEEVDGFPRHLSIHSGGFTLSQDPIIETVPVEPARMEGRTIIQWDKNDLDTTGLLKVDILALGFLTALHKICNLAQIDWREIPFDDRATFDMICRAETEGTFQIESRAQRSMLPKTQPRCFYDLVVQVAIVRPGPSVGEMVHPYVKRREAERQGRPYQHPDPVCAKILKRTYGVPIFQEQVMKLAIERAGFTPGESDQLRRSLASFRSAENVDKMADRFLKGLLQNGVSEEYAQELFGYLKGYAHYGFPESHAASFATITYKSAYLKCHYPAEFLCGLINSQPMGFYSVDMLIQSAKRSGVNVLPVHPLRSDWDATLEGPMTVRMGFREVNGLSQATTLAMIAEREREPFKSLEDFISRSGFTREVIEALALAGSFECFGNDPRQTLWRSMVRETEMVSPAPTAQFEQLTLFESMTAEHSAMNHSTRGNIMLALRQEIKDLPPQTSQDVAQAQARQCVCISGVTIVMQRPPTAKGTCFITLEDEFGTIDLVLKKNIYQRYKELISTNRLLIIKGTVQVFGGGHSMSRSIKVGHISVPQKTLRARNLRPGGHPRMIGPY